MSKPLLTRARILRLLRRISDALERDGVEGEILIFGGCAFVLAFKSRPATKDLDAVFEPKSKILSLADRLGEEEGLSKGWLNDAVKGFASQSGEVALFQELPALKIFVPSPEYLFAMKALSMRLSEESQDLADLTFLIGKLGIKSVGQAMKLVRRYYPDEMVPPKTQYALEELFERAFH